MLRSYNMQPMQEMVGTISEPKAIANVLDEVMLDYAMTKIDACEDGLQAHINNNIWHLRELRDRFRQME